MAKNKNNQLVFEEKTVHFLKVHAEAQWAPYLAHVIIKKLNNVNFPTSHSTQFSIITFVLTLNIHI